MISMAMDTHSSSDDHFIKEEEEEFHGETSSIITGISFPHQSLIVELQTLDLQHEVWTTDFKRAPFTRQDIWNLQQEAKLQQLIFMILLNHGVRSKSLDDIQTRAKIEVEQIQKLAAASKLYHRGFKAHMLYSVRWKSQFSKFLETQHQEIKPRLKEFCVEMVDRLLQGNYCSTSTTGEYDIFLFIYVILFKLKDFMNLKSNLVDPIWKQLKIVEQMLNYAPVIARKMTIQDENLQNFFKFFEPWVNTAAAIVILYWVEEKDEKIFSMVSSSLQKFNPNNILDSIEAYIIVIKALRPSNASEILVMRNAVEQFVKMILEKFSVSMDDYFEMFREGLAFWTALLVDPPKSDAEHEKLICAQTHLLLDQAKSLICSMCLKKLGEDIDESRNTLLNDFLEKINKAKAEVRQLQVPQVPGLSWNNGPGMITRGHFDFLLGNLGKKLGNESGLFPFEKHLIATVHEELSFLRPFLVDIFELQGERKELGDIWVKASNIAYLVDCVTDFCLTSADIPIWSNLMHLSDAIEMIQSIKTQISKIQQNDQFHSNRVFSAKVNSQVIFPARQEAYDATTKDNFKVGFIEEEQRIMDCLVAGEARRDVFAVVGTPGQGKTHLVQRVFQDTYIKHHFYKLAWCCISQAYDIEKVFIEILEDVCGDTEYPEEFHRLSKEDLADGLRKLLKGQRYLIVLDDMWDAEVWHDLQLAFPDDNNGSRILLTSRNHNVALKVTANCSIVELCPLSHEESWSLLQMKVSLRKIQTWIHGSKFLKI